MAEQGSENINARLRAGLEAAKAGDVAKARAILSKVVLEKPRSVEAWWWLGQVVDDTNQRIYCFKKVLNLDPSHPGARAKLGLQPWDKRRNAPSTGSGSSARTQRRILIILAILTLLVVVVGGGYIYLDSTGMLQQLLNPPTTVPSPTTSPAEEPSPTSAAVSLSSIPTWTPTPSEVPEPTQAPPTPTPASTSTPQPPTPEDLPEVSSAQNFDIVIGTGEIVIPAGSYFVMRFESDEEFVLEAVGTLTFHAVPDDEEVTPTLELYLQNILEEDWSASGVDWGDNPIINPGQFVSQDGTIIAALRNWGLDSITLENAGFTFAATSADGGEVYYGLTRQEIIPPTIEPTEEPENFD